MVSYNDVPEVYIFQGRDGEEVPLYVEELVFEPSVRVLPRALCYNRQLLRKVTLPKGLKTIGNNAFEDCKDLLEINEIPRTVQSLGEEAFRSCDKLSKVEFEDEATSPHQLQTIGTETFGSCKSLIRVKPPPSVTTVGEFAFDACPALIEANLSTTCISQIPKEAFAQCRSLQTVGLPKTLERICFSAFYDCRELVTVVVPLDSQPVRIGQLSFEDCRQLANLALPRGSTAEGDSFGDCTNFYHCFGTKNADDIVAHLICRFYRLDPHNLCYQHPRPTAQALRQSIEELDEDLENSCKDMFGMTPLHVLLSTPEPNMELLEVLLDSLPNRMLAWKDENGKRPLDYLINNLTDGTKSLLQMTLQKWMIDRVDRWGATSWMETMQGKVQELLAEDDKEQRTTLCNEAYSALEHYENQEVTSILEMALWKCKLKSEWTSDGTKRQALDREECRFLYGSDVAIPNVTMFLNTPPASEEEEED